MLCTRLCAAQAYENIVRESGTADRARSLGIVACPLTMSPNVSDDCPRTRKAHAPPQSLDYCKPCQYSVKVNIEGRDAGLAQYNFRDDRAFWTENWHSGKSSGGCGRANTGIKGIRCIFPKGTRIQRLLPRPACGQFASLIDQIRMGEHLPQKAIVHSD